MAMVESGAGLEVFAVGDTKGLELGRRAVDPNRDITQMHGLAGVDAEDQARVLAALYLTGNLRLVKAQCLGGLAGLLLGTTTEALQGFLVTLANPADIAFDIGF